MIDILLIYSLTNLTFYHRLTRFNPAQLEERNFSENAHLLFKKSLYLLGNKLHPLGRMSESSLREYESSNVCFCSKIKEKKKNKKQGDWERRYKSKEGWGRTAAVGWVRSRKMTHVEREGERKGEEGEGVWEGNPDTELHTKKYSNDNL